MLGFISLVLHIGLEAIAVDISLICAVKDREEHLLKSYESWLDCSCVDEIVIVDWGSKEPISKKLPDNDKIKIVQVNPDHAKYWSFSQAYSTAARFSSGSYLMLMNADEIILNPEKICGLEKPSSEFYYQGTSWASKRAHGVYFLYIRKKDFWDVNGYHERIIGYGYDDVDLQRRLKLELRQADVEIEHIRHDVVHRTRDNMLNYKISWSDPWKKGRKLIGLQYARPVTERVINCDIREKDRITYDIMLDREGDARACSLQAKGEAPVVFKQRNSR